MLSRKLPRLFHIDQVPQVFHEQGILFGYRHPQSSATACILSLFQMTNETLNIWTHLLPFWFLELQKPRLCKLLRVLAFAYPYTWDSLPIFYRLFLFPGESSRNDAILYHQKHMIMTLLASFLYSAHLPERLAPGRFDYIGHSHQLFHVCVILATHLQMEAILLDKTLRKEWLLATSRPFSLPQIAAALLLCIIFCLSNIIYFSAALYRTPEPELHEKET